MKAKRVRWAILVVATVYALSYVGLSRLSVFINRHHAAATNQEWQFYYVPCDETYLLEKYRLHDERLVKVHTVLSTLYYPIWWVDRHMFGGPPYAEHLPLLELRSVEDGP